MISGIVHGNEIAGAIVLDRLLKSGIKPLRGRLTFCFANPDAYSRFDPAQPTVSRNVDQDFNRLWAPDVLDGELDSTELRRARALRPIIDDVDALLDIHSMQGEGRSVAVAGGNPKALALALQLPSPQFVVSGELHDATKLRLRDYGRFGDPSETAVALQIEAGQHWQQTTADTAYDIALGFIDHFGMLPDNLRPAAPTEHRTLVRISEHVFIASDRFDFVEDFANGDCIDKAGTVIGYDGKKPIVTPYNQCFLVMPVQFRKRGGRAVSLAMLC
jgi:predicted deacylase